jgi:TP901 family phage tail tape measure protein
VGVIEVVHIVARVTTDMTRFNAGMASMEARAKTMTAKMSLAGMRMTKYLTLPIAGLAYAGVKTATSFQSSMTKIQTQAGAAAGALPKIQKGIEAMSGNSVTQGPKDLADAYYHLQSVMGGKWNVKEKLHDLKLIGQLSTIGGSNTEDTTSAVAGILRTHLRGAKNVESIVKTINGIVGSGNMRMPQFVESTGTAVLQVAKLLGMSLKQVGAAEAVFTDENMNANMSMTRLRTSLMMAIHPSQAAEKEMQKLGVSSQEIGTKMRGPNGFGNTLDYLGKAYDDYVKKLVANGKTQKQALTAANAALFGSFGGSKGASVWATLINQRSVFHKKEGQITAKEQAWNKDLAKSMKTMSAQFEKAWARIQVALIKFGTAVAPIALGMAKALVKIANAFTNLPTPIQHFVAAVGVGLAVLGPMLIMMSSIAKIIGPAGALAGGFGGVLPMALIAGVAALAYFALKSKTFRAWLKSWGTQVAGFFKWLYKDVIVPFAKGWYHFWTDGGDSSRWKTEVIPALQAVGHTFRTLGNIVKAVMGAIVGDFNTFLKIEGKIEDIAGKIFGWGQSANSAVGNFAKGAWGHLSGADYGPSAGMSPAGKAAYARALAGARAHGFGNDVGAYQAWQTHQKAAQAAHHHRKRRLHQRAGGGAVAQGMGYWVGEYGPEWFQPSRSGDITHGMPKGKGAEGRVAPLVHIAEMHVRNESDAEIVSGKMARRLIIP